MNKGSFDAELRDLAWFEPGVLSEGWYEYALPFSHDLIAAPAAPGGINAARCGATHVAGVLTAHA